MSLEAKIELLTAAVIELTAAMQALGAVEKKPSAAATATAADSSTQNQTSARASASGEAPNARPSSTGTTSGEPSAPTGESSSPAPTLDYVKDVKPITIQLSKEKGREITIGVLSRFGVKSAQDLDAGQWADYIAHCQKVLDGGEV